jgi:hypothetical protein
MVPSGDAIRNFLMWLLATILGKARIWLAADENGSEETKLLFYPRSSAANLGFLAACEA